MKFLTKFGTIRILETCKQAHLPDPELMEIDGGFMVTVFNNYQSFKVPFESDLNERQMNLLSDLKEKGEYYFI